MAERLDRDELLSERNVALLREAYMTMGRDDADSLEVADVISEDILIRDRPEAPDPQTYRGHEGVRQALATSDESFEDFTLEPIDLIGVGDKHVVVVLRMHGRGRGAVPVEEDRAPLDGRRRQEPWRCRFNSRTRDALRDARAG